MTNSDRLTTIELLQVVRPIEKFQDDWVFNTLMLRRQLRSRSLDKRPFTIVERFYSGGSGWPSVNLCKLTSLILEFSRRFQVFSKNLVCWVWILKFPNDSDDALEIVPEDSRSLLVLNEPDVSPPSEQILIIENAFIERERTFIEATFIEQTKASIKAIRIPIRWDARWKSK